MKRCTLWLLGLAAALAVPGVQAASLPTITCSTNGVLECSSTNGALALIQSTVTDADGDALMVVWTVNGHPVLTNVVASGITTNGVTLSLTNQFGHGTNDVSVGVTDDGTNVVMCSTTVVVVDTTPPVIELVTATPNLLWPPNHKMKTIQVRVKASDLCGPVRWRITDINSNEAIDGRGDGHTSPDWSITGPHKALVRAERAGPGNGRVYTLQVRAWDDSENSTNGLVKVYVPHDQGHGRVYTDPADWEDDDDHGAGKGKDKGKGNGNGKAKGKAKGKNK
jgi:hypothetical protein